MLSSKKETPSALSTKNLVLGKIFLKVNINCKQGLLSKVTHFSDTLEKKGTVNVSHISL